MRDVLMFRLVTAGLSFLLAFLAVASWQSAPSAGAHVFLFKAVPGEGAVLTEAPAFATAEFTSEVAPGMSTISVFAAEGAPMDAGDSSIDPENPKRVIVSLKTLPPGDYTFSWVAVDALDGHEATGSHTFTVSQ